MKWREIIRVRTLYETERALACMEAVKQSLADRPDLESAEIYRGLSTGPDVAMHLVWNDSVVPLYGSESGQRVASELSKLGLVDHTTWLEGDDADETPSAA